MEFLNKNRRPSVPRTRSGMRLGDTGCSRQPAAPRGHVSRKRVRAIGDDRPTSDRHLRARSGCNQRCSGDEQPDGDQSDPRRDSLSSEPPRRHLTPSLLSPLEGVRLNAFHRHVRPHPGLEQAEEEKSSPAPAMERPLSTTGSFLFRAANAESDAQVTLLARVGAGYPSTVESELIVLPTPTDMTAPKSRSATPLHT